MARSRVTLDTLQAKRQAGEPITALGAYDALMGAILDEAGIDLAFVGDSLGTAILGYRDVAEVTLDDMIHHAAAVVRGAPQMFVVCDLPLVSCEGAIPHTVSDALYAVRQTGASAVKIDGGREAAERIAAVVRAGVEVMGYVLYPDGPVSSETSQRFAGDVRALQCAGCFAVLLGNAPTELAAQIAERSSSIILSLNSGSSCHGYLALTYAMVGLCTSHLSAPHYAAVRPLIREAVLRFVAEVRSGMLPTRPESLVGG